MRLLHHNFDIQSIFMLLILVCSIHHIVSREISSKKSTLDSNKTPQKDFPLSFYWKLRNKQRKDVPDAPLFLYDEVSDKNIGLMDYFRTQQNKEMENMDEDLDTMLDMEKLENNERLFPHASFSDSAALDTKSTSKKEQHISEGLKKDLPFIHDMLTQRLPLRRIGGRREIEFVMPRHTRVRYNHGKRNAKFDVPTYMRRYGGR